MFMFMFIKLDIVLQEPIGFPLCFTVLHSNINIVDKRH